MPLYTFYPCKSDGGSECFETFELMDDEEAAVRALHVLRDHQSAAQVVAWCGERKVLTRSRSRDALRLVGGSQCSAATADKVR